MSLSPYEGLILHINCPSMVVAHRALRDQMFRKTMSTSNAVTLFDAGAGQVSVKAHGSRTYRTYQ